jgi:hypothetical protein
VFARALTGAALLSFLAVGQELPKSGTNGADVFYATSPGGTSQLYAVALGSGLNAIPLGSPVSAVPSRWAHRRRTLGALETAIAFVPPEVAITPMGTVAGTGAIHMVDMRSGPPGVSVLVPTGNPAGYDLAVASSLEFVFSAEDDGAGGTTLRGFSYATPGALNPLTPPALTITGSPAAYVNRIGYDAASQTLHVPTESGIQVVSLSASAPHMTAGPFISTGTSSPTTNPASFMRLGVRTWAVGTSEFNVLGAPTRAGFHAWTATGTASADKWGTIPNLAPPRNYVPAVGCEELAVVTNGTDTYVYYLLRDPSPTAFFIRPSAVGVVHFVGNGSPDINTIVCPDAVGEPFSIPTVHGTRVAFESSYGPPFYASPPGGGEVVSVIYSPLDPLGVGSPSGVLGVPAPLGGRISTKGMDRPIWSHDGSRIFAFTSHFPGAPNPGMPGIEVLDVPAGFPLTVFNSPHAVVPNAIFPDQAILMPSIFDPNDPAAASFLAGMSFAGNVFTRGPGSALALPFGEMGQFQFLPPIAQSINIPNFPAIFPAAFDDATASTVPIPGNFGARRVAFNLIPGVGLMGMVMTAAIGDVMLVQPTGYDFLASVGVFPAAIPPVVVTLPAGWTTTSEIASY